MILYQGGGTSNVNQCMDYYLTVFVNGLIIFLVVRHGLKICVLSIGYKGTPNA